MSYSSSFSSCATPGWNDPPAVLSPPRTNSPGTSIFASKHRRPVHPSIQASSIPKINPNPVQPAFSFVPQAAISTLAPSQIPNATSNQSEVLGIAPPAHVPNQVTMDTFIPYSSSSTNVIATPPINRSSDGKILSEHHRSIFDVFTVPDPGQEQIHRCSSAGNEVSATEYMFTQASDKKLFQNFSQNSPDWYSKSVHSVPSIESNPNALIYTPPNMIGDVNKRPATSPYPTDYVAPIKAAGDVSLSGFQLVQFLTKAAHRLPAGVTRDGIQLRINQLSELFDSGRVTEGCIKKLNFVVDALDRGLFDEAYQFFQQLQAQYPTETRTSWAQGIRLLLNELRHPARAGSAGLTRYI